MSWLSSSALRYAVSLDQNGATWGNGTFAIADSVTDHVHMMFFSTGDPFFVFVGNNAVNVVMSSPLGGFDIVRKVSKGTTLVTWVRRFKFFSPFFSYFFSLLFFLP
jgi:hypothetical protein